jgi:hypothetical protein
VKDLYNENSKTLKKKMEEDTRRSIFMDWQNSCCENGYSNIQVHGIPMSFFTEIEKSILNSCGSTKDTK